MPGLIHKSHAAPGALSHFLDLGFLLQSLPLLLMMEPSLASIPLATPCLRNHVPETWGETPDSSLSPFHSPSPTTHTLLWKENKLQNLDPTCNQVRRPTYKGERGTGKGQ